MLIRACASFSAIPAKVPGRFSRRTVTACSSANRYFPVLSASLARARSLTRRRILPRPAVSGAQSAVMFTPASASVRASFARTPGFDSRPRTSWIVLGMTIPPLPAAARRRSYLILRASLVFDVNAGWILTLAVLYLQLSAVTHILRLPYIMLAYDMIVLHM